ncbi:MAG: helix-turn-helix domain-containing protein [Alkaliphilus sp.]
MFPYGKRIKDLRKLMNLSANKLSKLANVDSSTISKIENNSAYPSLQLLEKICSVFDISLAHFFSDANFDCSKQYPTKDCDSLLVAEDSIEYATNKEIKELNTESKKDLKKYIEFLKLKESEK